MQINLLHYSEQKEKSQIQTYREDSDTPEKLGKMFSLVGLQPMAIAQESDKGKSAETHCGNKASDLERTVDVAQYHRMTAFFQGNGYHRISYSGGLCNFSVHPNLPVAILGDGGIKKPVPIAGNISFYAGGGKGSQFPCAGI